MGAQASPSLLRHEIGALLEAYDRLLHARRGLPLVLWVRRGDGRISRRLRVPRLRLFLRYFLVSHMARTLAELRRSLYARSAIAARPQDYDAELDAVERLEKALPPLALPRRRAVAALAALGAFCFFAFVVGDPLVHHVAAPAARAIGLSPEATPDARPLGNMAQALVPPDKKDILSAFESFACADGGGCSPARGVATITTAVVLLSITFWLVLLLPITSFRLKRMLFTDGPEHEFVRASAASHGVWACDGVYELERAAFRSIGAQAPREVPFDLLAQATIAFVPLLLVGVLVGLTTWETEQAVRRSLDAETLVGLAFVYAFVAVVGAFPVSRFVLLTRVARSRNSVSARYTTAVKPSRRLRRFAATLVDSALVAAVTVALALGAPHPDDAAVAFVVAWFLVAPGVAAAYAAWAGSRRGGRRGQTLGKQLLRIRTVRADGAEPGRLRMVVRDGLLKWSLLGLSSIVLLGVPFLLDAVWMLGRQRRTLHDVVADTLVVPAG